MLFCLGDGRYESKGDGYQKNNMVFNTRLTPDEFSKIRSSLPTIKVAICRWVDKDDMTDDEKEEYTIYKTIGGYLKRLSYEDAWAITWLEMSDVDKNKILSIPQFDAKIFKTITGIDTKKDDEVQKAIDLLTAKVKLVDGRILL